MACNFLEQTIDAHTDARLLTEALTIKELKGPSSQILFNCMPLVRNLLKDGIELAMLAERAVKKFAHDLMVVCALLTPCTRCQCLVHGLFIPRTCPVHLFDHVPGLCVDCVLIVSGLCIEGLWRGTPSPKLRCQKKGGWKCVGPFRYAAWRFPTPILGLPDGRFGQPWRPNVWAYCAWAVH